MRDFLISNINSTRLYFILFFLFAPLGLMGQEPAYIRIGDQEMAGIGIYGIEQDTTGDLLLATEHGFYKFDGYEFLRRPNKMQKSGSVFGITRTTQNRCFCFNLSGQIFEYREDSLHMFFQLPDSLLSSAMHISAGDDGELFVSCKVI